MLTYYDSNNNPVKLLKELGRGGEGAVYFCEDETLVGKIYHEPVSDEKAEKLCWMAEHGTPQLLKTTAWIAQILRAKPDGKVTGFLMPKIKAKEIHELYSPKSRRVFFPDATWHFLIHTATNLARAFHNLHKDGHVMGDVNQGNCVVTADGKVKLIDCDSYEITTDKKVYPCEVGVTTHIPPELQGRNLRGIDRSDNHDNFGLAIIIFQLLFLGRHPFAGNYLGAEDKTIEDAIRQHLFVYGRDAEKKNVVRPPGTLPLSAVSAPVAELFERAFSEKNERPKPVEWAESLEYLAQNLRQCLIVPGHIFYSRLIFCPWCEIENNTGLTLFPLTSSGSFSDKKYEKNFDLPIIKDLIADFDVSNFHNAILSDDVERVSPSRAILRERRKQTLINFLKCGIYLNVMIFLRYRLNSECFFVIFMFGAAIFWVMSTITYSGTQFYGLMIDNDNELEMLSKEKEDIRLSFQKYLKKTNVLENVESAKNKLRKYEEPSSKNVKRELQNEIGDILLKLRISAAKEKRQLDELKSKLKKVSEKFPLVVANEKALKRHVSFSPYFVATNVLFFALIVSGYLPVWKDDSISRSSETYDSVPPDAVVPPKPTVAVPDESITDKEIALIPPEKRKMIIDALLDKSSASFDTNGSVQAVRWLKFAQRFDKNNVALLNRLGYVEYSASNYKNAQKYLENARKINPEKVDLAYLGMTYLELEKYKEAREIFSRLNSKATNTQNLSNLGNANFGLKDYQAAISNYYAILKISPGDTSAMYQIGICYAEMGDVQGVLETYDALKSFDSNLAEEMKEDASKLVNLENIAPTLPSRIIVTEAPNTANDEPLPPKSFVIPSRNKKERREK